MTRIHVVVASIGEYSDRHEWVVRAFRNQSDAEEYVRRMQPAARACALEICEKDLRWFSEKPEVAEICARWDVTDESFPGFDPGGYAADDVDLYVQEIELTP